VLTDWVIRTVSETSGQVSLRCKSPNIIVCIYLVCLIYGHRLPCCPLVYLLPCRNHGIPIKSILAELPNVFRLCLTGTLCTNTLLVEMAGVEPASRTLFSLLHTAITLIILYNFLQGKSDIVFILIV